MILGRKPFSWAQAKVDKFGSWTQAILPVLGRRPVGLIIDLTFGLTIFSFTIFVRTDRVTDRQSDGRKVETIAHFSVFDGKMC